MKMCNAISGLNIEVTLLAIPKVNGSDTNVYSYYGLKNNFEIKYLPWSKNYQIINSIIYRFSSVYSAMYAIFNRHDYILGRDINACIISILIGIPTILELHQPPETLGIFQKLFLCSITSRKNMLGIIVISAYLKEKYINFDLKLKNKILIAHDAADEIQRANDIPSKNDKIQVGYVGQLYRGRGMEIIKEVARYCEHMDFNIIGGMDEDIKKWKNECSQINNINFYGFVTPIKARQCMYEQDILIAPYTNVVTVLGKNDTSKWMSPLKLFEYMATKKPIICSDIKVLKEVLIDGYNCLLCDPKSIAKWVSALNRLSNDKNLRMVLADNAYSTFKNNHTWEIRTNNIIKKFIV